MKDEHAQHIRDYDEQKRILPEWYNQQWSTTFAAGRDILGRVEPVTITGNLIKAEEKEGAVYFTVEVQDNRQFSSGSLLATFTGPFWFFSSTGPDSIGKEQETLAGQ